MEIINLGNKIVNSYLYPVGNGFVLVDTGYPDGFSAFNQRLQALAISVENITTIFITHSHDDHVGFLNEMLHHTKASVVLHQKTVEALHRGENSKDGKCSSRFSQFLCKLMNLVGKSDHAFPKIEPGFEDRLIVLNEHNKLQLEKELGARIIETPGHTACSLSLFLENGDLFCGDAAMNGFPTTRRTSLVLENADEYQRSWKAIIQLHPRMIYPGHGNPFPPSDLERYLPTLEDLKLYSPE